MAVFARLLATRMCPECTGPMKLYITEEGVQLLACLNCQFEIVDRDTESLSGVRQLVARDRREHAERKAAGPRGVKKSERQ